MQSFFRTEKGERMTTHKSDVWSAGVAMMNVLIGKTIDSDIQEKVYNLYFILAVLTYYVQLSDSSVSS